MAQAARADPGHVFPELITHCLEFCGMCMQCMAGAMTAGAGATGVRAWLGAHSPRWMTARRLKSITVAILAVGILAAGSSFASHGSDPDRDAAAQSSSYR